MICEFCGADNADGHRVATKLGRAAVLCEQCRTQHGKQAGRQPERLPKTKKRRESKDLSGQTYFPFYQTETVGSADATVS